MENQQENLCPRYSALVIENVNPGPSPKWLCDRLLAIGLRPINNIVDITNFVMMEYGQPLHAFDYELLSGKKIIIRNAKKGEPFTSLDGRRGQDARRGIPRFWGLSLILRKSVESFLGWD